MAILTFSLCLEMYKVSTSRSAEVMLSAASYTTVALWGFIALFGLPAELMVTEVNEIYGSIYSSAWYNYPEEKRTVLMIITNAQREVCIQAGRFLTINLATSMNTVKTMVSYCMFLQTVIVDEE
ncbi:unnamed protein product [Acanthoscelides obtectus]|uniref:Uncharacterized protein n=1 Tax=Acanthoscelides obtectus TaxID=200917 RepID=A0A9P0P0V0_ACAOB|nr:unnamed protein product [Acanthoscelides obtectus]CAK1622733.1 hypothetical protein AOBTE_LOCUS1648 [Acanthoscelides obtectus]